MINNPVEKVDSNKKIRYSYTVIDKKTGKPRIKEDIGIPTRELARESKREWWCFGVEVKIIQTRYEQTTVNTKEVR